jgi:hypothetical protein
MTTAAGSAVNWLTPLLPGIAELTDLDVRRLGRFEETLHSLLAKHPCGPGVEPRQRSQRLQRLKG